MPHVRYFLKTILGMESQHYAELLRDKEQDIISYS